MKRILLLLGVLTMFAASGIVLEQVPEGVITYEVKTNMYRRLPADRQHMKNTMPEFNIFKDQLFFNPSESLYKPVEEDEEEFAGALPVRTPRPTCIPRQAGTWCRRNLWANATSSKTH